MARIQILSKQQEKSFNATPRLSYQEKNYYFDLPTDLIDLLYTTIKPTNLAYVILQYGFFRAANRFFDIPTDDENIEFVKKRYKLDVIDLDIASSSLNRYHRLIKARLAINDYTDEMKAALQKEAIEMANTFQDRRKIFFALIRLSKDLNIEVPSFTQLSLIISEALDRQKNSLIDRLRPYEKDAGLDELDMFTQKDDEYKNRYNIMSFKKLGHSTAKGKMGESLAKLKIIKTKFTLNEKTIERIGLTPNIARYYARWIEKSQVSQLTQKRDALDVRFLLLSFI